MSETPADSTPTTENAAFRRAGESFALEREALTDSVHRVQRIPYAWPVDPTSASVRRNGAGTCAGKHALLRETLERLGFTVSRLMVVGTLAPEVWPDIHAAGRGLLEVHECLTVETGWAGPLLVDVTWHPAAIRAGLRGTLQWTGMADMTCTVEPVAFYAVADERFRDQKELLRDRLYSAEDRARRDRVLTLIATRAAGLT